MQIQAVADYVTCSSQPTHTLLASTIRTSWSPATNQRKPLERMGGKMEEEEEESKGDYRRHRTGNRSYWHQQLASLALLDTCWYMLNKLNTLTLGRTRWDTELVTMVTGTSKSGAAAK